LLLSRDNAFRGTAFNDENRRSGNTHGTHRDLDHSWKQEPKMFQHLKSPINKAEQGISEARSLHRFPVKER
jgi:hypothetical protein